MFLDTYHGKTLKYFGVPYKFYCSRK